MQNKTKLAIFDLDGTLFDTKNVNYNAYKKALEIAGFDVDIDYKYYCDFCNGNNYKVFLPEIVPGISEESMREVHDNKKKLYKDFLKLACINKSLFSLIESIKNDYIVAITTTASRENVEDILNEFHVKNLFDLIITQEDVTKTKPDPECFITTLKRAGVGIEDAIIYEDSDVGLEAARNSGISYVRVYGYN